MWCLGETIEQSQSPQEFVKQPTNPVYVGGTTTMYVFSNLHQTLEEINSFIFFGKRKKKASEWVDKSNLTFTWLLQKTHANCLQEHVRY